MWIDERGSEVLTAPECHRLLAVGAEEHRHGHLGISQPGAPIVLPLNYAVHGTDVLVQIGEGVFERVESQLVAFQVDGASAAPGTGGPPPQIWSVLLQGLAVEESQDVPGEHIPHPQVAIPGERLVRIRADVVTGRRFSSRPVPERPS